MLMVILTFRSSGLGGKEVMCTLIDPTQAPSSYRAGSSQTKNCSCQSASVCLCVCVCAVRRGLAAATQ